MKTFCLRTKRKEQSRGEELNYRDYLDKREHREIVRRDTGIHSPLFFLSFHPASLVFSASRKDTRLFKGRKLPQRKQLREHSRLRPRELLSLPRTVEINEKRRYRCSHPNSRQICKSRFIVVPFFSSLSFPSCTATRNRSTIRIIDTCKMQSNRSRLLAVW